MWQCHAVAVRLFVAVWPPPEIISAIAALERPELRGLRWTSPEQWHVTVRFMGEVADVDAAVAALRSVRASPVEARMGPETGRFGHRILHVPVSGLEDVAAAVVGATTAVGQPPEDRPFRGHVTLARVRDRARVDLRPLCGQPLGGSWRVEQVVLVASHLRHEGAHYETVATQAFG